MTSYLFNGQWTTDKYNRKYRHMCIIPFPVCGYAAIHYEGRQLMNEQAGAEIWHRHSLDLPN